MKILKYEEYYNWEILAQEFLEHIKNPMISESEESELGFQEIVSRIFKRLGIIKDDVGKEISFNLGLVTTFGTGVKLIYPVVSNLISNMRLEINPTKEDVVLLCITIISIIYLRNKKDAPISADDIKNKLNAELSMKFGNPRIFVGRFVKCFKSIFIFLQKFPKLFGVALGNILDMFSYTSILIPIMNAIGMFCKTQQLTPDTLMGNLLSLGVGISTITGKSLINYIKGKFNKKDDSDNQIEDELSQSPKLIQEQ
jgi:hypothetical protein